MIFVKSLNANNITAITTESNSHNTIYKFTLM